MTQVNLSFRIDRVSAVMRLSNIPASMTTSSLPSNVSYVQFDTVKGGAVIYNDRPGLPELFIDPSPYQSFVNAWITAMATATPALTLSQAQAIKNALINAIYAVNRQLPVSVAVSAGNFPWDASDAAVTRLSALSGLLYIDPLNTVINGGSGQTGGLSQLVTDLNVWAAHFNTLNTNFGGLNSGLQTAFNGLATNVTAALSTTKSNLDAAEPPGVANWTTTWSVGNCASVTAPATSGAAADSNLVESFSSVGSLTVPTMQLIPVGSSAPVTVTPTDLQKIVLAIAAQTVKYQSTALAKQAAVNALSTIAAVSAYDATTGW